MDKEGWLVDVIMRAVGLKRVEDTFVGNDKVRGVSGGEKKRVTVAEMMAARTFVDCFDEISTGLDAATTFDICKVLGEVNRMKKTIRLVDLLKLESCCVTFPNVRQNFAKLFIPLFPLVQIGLAAPAPTRDCCPL